MKKKSLLTSLVFLTVLSADSQSITGILGAFPPELVLLESEMTQKQDTVISQVRFIRGQLRGRNVVLAETGVGKVNAAITTVLMIQHFKPREIVFSGIAGGVDPALAPGDLVIGTQVSYHDFGQIDDAGMHYWATKNPFTKKDNPLKFQCDSALVSKALSVSKTLSLAKVERDNGSFVPAVKKGIIVTGDVFVSSEKTTRRLLKDLNAAATEMEGAAIAQTCYQQNIPFLIIRSLSDKADGKAKRDMDQFYDVAARNAATLVMAVIGEK
ncbi:5'-methylthioadenosine/adenosylhomocysteine nucleosidase [Dyadobacter sp. CY261]|uniref:5'-methylthioadenosine/adenosylhomocysteine nucleosidase n=1 Tax=Dyadobacter sp. CY261 TaxID=2907203 RepID=UPI001F23812E|nr:5'-methylthioadenosine/adenosylhomocysteine nucleosidase [Dyadobacter sp. CY261]MCF0071237.1 5'-methylthioadenosine/adenosylhomocysteine nucleosidase [Dyadobacter sp. CY261]